MRAQPGVRHRKLTHYRYDFFTLPSLAEDDGIVPRLLRVFARAISDLWLKRSKRLARTHNTDDPNISPRRLLQYFEENRSRLIYRWAIDHNLPISSDSVESAARHIVQQQLKLSGMRWSDSGAKSIVNLRNLHGNVVFEQYWEDYAKIAAWL